MKWQMLIWRIVLILAALLGIAFGCIGIALAQDKSDESYMLENLRRMRIKQQDHENVIRAQIFKTVKQEQDCTPVQQTRQRLRDLRDDSNDTDDENIIINAGHEELNVTDNHGTINSDVNIQVIKQGREIPCP